jgi:hypothetical protein
MGTVGKGGKLKQPKYEIDHVPPCSMNWDSSVGIGTMLQAGHQVNRDSIAGRGSNLYRPQSVQTSTGTYTVSFSLDIDGAFLGDKASTREADNLNLVSTLRMSGVTCPLPHMPSKSHNFNFYVHVI